MIVNIEKPYSDMLQKIIEFGFAIDTEEAVKQSILSYTNQINFEELYLVDKAVNSEMNNIENNNIHLISFDKILDKINL